MGTQLLLGRASKALFVPCGSPASASEFDSEMDMLTCGLFRGAWMSALFIHYEVKPERLQPEVPFPLDVRDGKAYVSVVAFSQERLRFAFGGNLTNWVGRWFANHEFLNVRTYVRQVGEPGI